MILEILKDTPWWVAPAFLLIAAMGYSHSKRRTVSRARAYILPFLMIGLAINGVISAFGLSEPALLAWAAGVGTAFWPGAAFFSPREATYDRESQTFSVPGSWAPMALLLLIFGTKYFVGGMMAHHAPVTQTSTFVVCVSFVYGCFSGLFFARAQVIWAIARRTLGAPESAASGGA